MGLPQRKRPPSPPSPKGGNEQGNLRFFVGLKLMQGCIHDAFRINPKKLPQRCPRIAAAKPVGAQRQIRPALRQKRANAFRHRAHVVGSRNDRAFAGFQLLRDERF